MYYPTPSALNPTAQQYYDKNIFCVTRQLYYSKEKTDSIDVYISLNGLPIMTMELKNHYTGQTVENAIKQYKEDRDPKADPTALILQKRRCAVHFAVDDDDIMMCTELKGNASWFLPFNKGVNGGAGNPVSPNGVRTAYLWEDVLGKRSLSDILENYAQITFKEKEVKNKKTGKREKKTIESIIGLATISSTVFVSFSKPLVKVVSDRNSSSNTRQAVARVIPSRGLPTSLWDCLTALPLY